MGELLWKQEKYSLSSELTEKLRMIRNLAALNLNRKPPLFVLAFQTKSKIGAGSQ